MTEIGLVGTGLRSDVVTHLLARDGEDIAVWSPDGEVPDDFPDAATPVDVEHLADTPLVFVCLPMHRMRSTIRTLGDHLSGRHALVHTTRTLTADSLDPISALFEAETPTRRFGFLSGPMRREDLLAGRGGSALCASPFPEVWDMVDEALDAPKFRVYRSDDLSGSECAAAYARVIAVAYGICVELELGDSILSTLFARGLDEMAQFVTDQGGGEATSFGLAGAGNLHAGTTGTGHIDFRIGRAYVDRGAPDLETFRADLDPIEDELFPFLRALRDYAREAPETYSILQALDETVFGDVEFDVAFEKVMARTDADE